jgi:hypothetical protein
MELKRLLGGILLLALLQIPVPAFGVVNPPTSSVALAWDGSPSPEVTGYRVSYGAASGIYTNSVAMGNVTNITVPNLTSGVTYFFAVSAFDSNGLESAFSNEIAYTVPVVLPTMQIRVSPTRQIILTLVGQEGRTYDIQATEDLTVWTGIGTVKLGASGAIDITDTNAARFSQRFYRTRHSQP